MTREFLPGDHTRCLDCAKLNHGKSAVDVCQECSGLSTQCVGCDGNPDPNDARRAKFDAWSKKRGTPQDLAMKLYIELVEKLLK